MKDTKSFTFSFSARLLGAIGTHSYYTHTVWGVTEEEARLKLYDRFEHIYCIKRV